MRISVSTLKVSFIALGWVLFGFVNQHDMLKEAV